MTEQAEVHGKGQLARFLTKLQERYPIDDGVNQRLFREYVYAMCEMVTDGGWITCVYPRNPLRLDGVLIRYFYC